MNSVGGSIGWQDKGSGWGGSSFGHKKEWDYHSQKAHSEIAPREI